MGIYRLHLPQAMHWLGPLRKLHMFPKERLLHKLGRWLHKKTHVPASMTNSYMRFRNAGAWVIQVEGRAPQHLPDDEDRGLPADLDLAAPRHHLDRKKHCDPLKIPISLGPQSTLTITRAHLRRWTTELHHLYSKVDGTYAELWQRYRQQAPDVFARFAGAGWDGLAKVLQHWVLHAAQFRWANCLWSDCLRDVI